MDLKRYLVLGLLVLAGLSTSGCAAILIGAGTAVGTYAMVQGNAEGFSDVGYDQMWDAARTTLKEMGAVVFEDVNGGILRAKVAGSDVTIELSEVSDATTKMRVSARRFLFPNEKLAEEVYIMIAKKF